jgi:hypothetical protein
MTATVEPEAPAYDQCALDPPYELEVYAYELRTALADFTGPRFDFDGATFAATTLAAQPEPEVQP